MSAPSCRRIREEGEIGGHRATIPAVRRTPNLLLILLPLLLVAAATPTEPGGDGSTVEAVPGQAPVVAVYDWIRILPAPRAPLPSLQWPLRGVLTQPFGCTDFELERPAANCPGGYHTGLDIARSQGVPIQASAPGLAYSFSDPQRYGNHVIIQHAGGYATVYAHMVRTNTSWGQAVAAGDVIGWVGSTGNSTGPHLHFEVRYGGVPVDPATYLDGGFPAVPFVLPAGWPGSARDDWLGRR